MHDKEKLKMLKDILNSGAVLEEPKGVLKVAAMGESPEEAKEKIMKGLQKVHLPDEEEMGEEMMSDEEEEYPEESCDMMAEEDMSDEDSEILDMLPTSQKESFKKRLLEKIKNM